MILKKIKIDVGIGDLTNCYIIMDKDTKEAIIIDPAGNANEIMEMLKVLEAKVKYIIITHCHGDHTSALKEIKNLTNGKILAHILEAENINDDAINLNSYIGIQQENIEIDARVNDRDIIHIGNIQFEIIHTPGHTNGSICIYCKEYGMLFSGDTLFRGTWGRTDLPTGSFTDIIRSIENKIMILPEETFIYPGHGKTSIIKEEEVIYLNLKPKEVY